MYFFALRKALCVAFVTHKESYEIILQRNCQVSLNTLVCIKRHLEVLFACYMLQ